MKKKLLFSMVSMVIALSACNTASNGAKPSEAANPAVASTEKPVEKVNFNETGMPIVNEKITLKGMIQVTPGGGEHATNLGWQKYEELTNIHIDWQEVPNTTIEEKRNLALASNDLPDFFYNCYITPGELDKYSKNGTLIPLDDYIDKYAPNYKNMITEYPTIGKGNKTNGKTYSFPYANVADPVAIMKRYINIDWLAKVGKTMPTTTEEFYDIAVAFRDNDANDNGDPNDEIPWSGRNFKQVYDSIRGSFGIGTRGINHPYVDIDESTNTLRFIPTSEGFKQTLLFLNKMYTEKLLDQEIFQMNGTKIAAKLTANTVGAHSDYVGVTANMKDKFVGSVTLKGPEGYQINAQVYSTILNKATFVITATNKYPAETVRWADYFYSDEGQKMFFLGFEGITYKADSNGYLDFVEDIKDNKDGLSMDQAKAKYILFQGGPSLVTEKYFRGADMYYTSVEGAALCKPYSPKEVWESFSYTADEVSKRSPIEADMKTYYDEMVAAFVTGAKPFSEWDKYCDEYSKMGLDTYMQIYKEAYDRYNQ